MLLKRFLLASVSFAVIAPFTASAQTATPVAQPPIPPAAAMPRPPAAPVPAVAGAAIPTPGATAPVIPTPPPTPVNAAAPAIPPAPVTTATPAAAPVISPPVTASVITATATASTPASTGNPNAPITRAELPALVKEAIMNNPDMIMEAVKKLHDKQVEQSSNEAKQALEKHKAEIYDDTTSPSVGDPKKADVTLVEFFDYHCGYCKHMLPVITQLVNEDKKVRVIFREFPILSEGSVTASRAALAFNHLAPEKYFEFHTALMQSKTLMKMDEKHNELIVDPNVLSEISQKLGVDGKKLKKEMEKPEYTAMLDKNRALADDLGIRGTPALLIGDQMLPGAVPIEDLKKMVENERSGTKSAPAPDAKASPEPAPAKPAS